MEHSTHCLKCCLEKLHLLNLASDIVDDGSLCFDKFRFFFNISHDMIQNHIFRFGTAPRQLVQTRVELL